MCVCVTELKKIMLRRREKRNPRKSEGEKWREKSSSSYHLIINIIIITTARCVLNFYFAESSSHFLSCCLDSPSRTFWSLPLPLPSPPPPPSCHSFVCLPEEDSSHRRHFEMATAYHQPHRGSSAITIKTTITTKTTNFEGSSPVILLRRRLSSNRLTPHLLLLLLQTPATSRGKNRSFPAPGPPSPTAWSS